MPTQLDAIIDFRQIFFRIIKNWFFFAISLFIAFSIAFAYNRYTYELYMVETSLLIKEENSIATASDLLNTRVPLNKKSIENKELMIKSFPLVYKTLQDLRFDISYYIEGNIKTSEVYTSPIHVRCANTEGLRGRVIRVETIDFNSFLFIDTQSKEEQIKQFNEKFLFYGVEISIKQSTLHPFNEGINPPVIVKFYDLQYLTQLYQNKILVTQKHIGSTVINISILSQDQEKGAAFLNKLTDNYIKHEVNEKNIESINTVRFINKQLLLMTDSLALIEQQIQEYKDNNQVPNLSLKAQSIYNNIIGLESEFAKRNIIDAYYDDLSEYLSTGENFEGVSVPSSFGVNNENLNILITRLVEIQTKKNILIDGGQVNNPAIVQYNRQIKQLVINLQEAIKTSRVANTLMLLDSKRRIAKNEKVLGGLPKIERELLSIERLQLISEDIYTFLLKKRAEARITASSNVSDSKVLEPAMSFNKTPVSPEKNKSYIIALFLGLILPLLVILIREIINDKVVTRSDLEQATSIPVLGMISRNYSGYTLLSEQSPKSAVFEGFRVLRSNLNFFNTKTEDKVYLVTSSISGEGKTYIAENLAIVFAHSGKKTLLIGADLRRPKIYTDFKFDNNLGISSYILGDNSVEEVIFKTDIENLEILISGPIPKNPGDVLVNKKFSAMMCKLKQEYDIILIDTPPLGLVADALTLMQYSDINLYVVRQDFTQKGLLAYVDDMNAKERLGNLQIVFNDIKEGSGAYAYGYSYGYAYGDSYGYSQNSEYFDNEDQEKKV